ncbi:leucine-rich repeat domain-containing protein [Chamaesiphon minutus]|uniref:Leucine Rich Repeat (LRR)-containing protein n=1 Tax=Chamaesiphon minutus (strain ATCC 27169 / PCC 6605) TaxID=1173020 RepID=K9ULV7_CHAP6|nr:leucine-rich repeat domain-containing protein [Chamaesiphon minutus]AFY95648.1 Leucine Rich Repeat (LRR)-containing protein [Chamaesiphon minutus PCC 6605]
MSATTAELARLIERMTPNSTVLDLRGYKLETLPENIGNLTHLTKLNLNGNRLTSLPESIGNLTNLTELYLNGHKLTNLPESIGNLVNLTRLDLNGDRLNGLPESVGNLTNLTALYLDGHKLKTLPESIGNLTNLTKLALNGGFLHSLPDSFANLINLTKLKLGNNQFDRIPDILFCLPRLKKIYLRDNPLNDISNLKHIPKLSIFNCGLQSEFKIYRKIDTTRIDAGNQYLDFILSDLDSFTNVIHSSYGSRCIYIDKDAAHVFVQETIDGFLSYLSKLPKLKHFSWGAGIYPPSVHPIVDPKDKWNLRYGEARIYFSSWLSSGDLSISAQHLQYLPDSLCGLKCLKSIRFGLNSLTDLSILNQLPNLSRVNFLETDLPRRYWTKLSEWQPEWLLDENNAEIRRRIIDLFGYEKICEVLNATKIDTWREYILLKIENSQPVFERIGLTWPPKPVGKEPIALLKMTCPSTGHVHMLRVPPDMTSAEEAIVWVNHGIHPDRFTIQT